MQLEFANRPAIIVERKTQYLSQNLTFFKGGYKLPTPLLPAAIKPSAG